MPDYNHNWVCGYVVLIVYGEIHVTCNLCVINIKDLLDIYKWSCGPFCVPLLPDRQLKDQAKADSVYIFQQ